MRFIAAVLLAVLPFTAAADSHFVEQAQEALSNAQVFEDYSIPTAADVLAIPVETDLPQTTMDEPTLQEAGSLATSGDTTEGTSYRTFSDNAVEWSVQSADQTHLDQADTVVGDPETHLTENPFSTTGGQCTVTDFSSAPEFERTCQRTRDVFAASCTSTLDITVIRTEQYQCHVTPTGVACDELLASPLCVESERICNLLDIEGNRPAEGSWDFFGPAGRTEDRIALVELSPRRAPARGAKWKTFARTKGKK